MAVTVTDDRVFVADIRNGLQMVDCQDLEHLRVVAALGSSIKARGMVIVEEKVFFSAGWGGVVALPLPCLLDRRGFQGPDRLVFCPPSLKKKGYYSLYLSDGERSLTLPDFLFFDGRTFVARPAVSAAGGPP
jgi:hypothetical protein